MCMSFKAFADICSKHGLVAADGGTFWTVYRRWQPHALARIPVKKSKALDSTVYRVLQQMLP